MDKHTKYLLTDANVDDMVLRFRQVAGVKNPPGKLCGWEKMFPAHAAQFLIGAGNTLRWGENAELGTASGLSTIRAPSSSPSTACHSIIPRSSSLSEACSPIT
jgi:hypothetical protein